jgi:hypothetical protein
MMSASLYHTYLATESMTHDSQYYVSLPLTCAYIYHFCLLVLCLLNWTMFAFLYDVCLPVWGLYVCSIVLYLPIGMMSAYLYYVWLPVWYKCHTTCILLLIWCLVPCMMSAYPYDVCLPAWCLPSCVTSPQNDVCIPVLCFTLVWRLLNCMMYVQLCDVFTPVCYLFNYMTSAVLYDVRSTVQ